MNRLVVAAVALTFVAVGPSQGIAQTTKKKKPTWKQKRKAKRYILRGNRFKALGDRYRWRRKKKAAAKQYKKAAIVYIASYKIVEQASVIYKLANLYMRRGEMEWALRGYKRYVELKPKGGASRRAKRMIARLERVIRGQRAAGKLVEGDPVIDPTEVYGDEPDPPPEKEPDPPPEKEPEPPPEKKQPKVVKKKLKIDKPKPAAPGKNYRLAGLGTIGVGVVLFAVGVKFGLDASSASSDLSGNEDGWTAEDRQRIKDGESASNKMLLFTILGSAALVGGGLLYYQGQKLGRRPRTESKKVTWAPALTPDSLSIAVMGRF